MKGRKERVDEISCGKYSTFNRIATLISYSASEKKIKNLQKQNFIKIRLLSISNRWISYEGFLNRQCTLWRLRTDSGRRILSKWDRVTESPGTAAFGLTVAAGQPLEESWPLKVKLTVPAWALAGAGQDFQIKPWSLAFALLSLVLSTHFFFLPLSLLHFFSLSKTDLEFLASGMLLRTAYSEKLAFHKDPDWWRRGMTSGNGRHS